MVTPESGPLVLSKRSRTTSGCQGNECQVHQQPEGAREGDVVEHQLSLDEGSHEGKKSGRRLIGRKDEESAVAGKTYRYPSEGRLGADVKNTGEGVACVLNLSPV